MEETSRKEKRPRRGVRCAVVSDSSLLLHWRVLPAVIYSMLLVGRGTRLCAARDRVSFSRTVPARARVPCGA